MVSTKNQLHGAGAGMITLVTVINCIEHWFESLNLSFNIVENNLLCLQEHSTRQELLVLNATNV